MKLEAFPQAPQSLIARIEQSVHSRTGGRIRGLRVEIVDGEVVISGRTSTYYSKQLATHAVLSAVEDVSLTNEIEVC